MLDSSPPANGPSGRRLYLRLLREMLAHWRPFAIALVTMMLVAATEPAIPMVLHKVVSSFETRDLSRTPMLAGLLVLVFLVRGSATLTSAAALAGIAGKLAMDLRVRMFARLMVVPMAFYDRHRVGTLSSKITYDATQVMQAATHVVLVLVRDTLATLGLLAWMFYLNWQLTLIALAAAPLVMVVVLYLSDRLRRMSRLLQTAMGEVTHASLEGMEGRKVIRSQGAEAGQRERFRATVHRARRFQVRFEVTSAANAPIAQIITACALAVILIVSARHFDAGRITLAEFVSFFTAMGMLFAPLKRLTRVNGQLQTGIAAAGSVFGLIDEGPEPDRGTRDLGQARGLVEFRAVSFSYRHGKADGVRAVDLRIEPGETVALVGASGAGKSTLASLLLRFYEPDSGVISVDGTDVRELRLASLRRNIAFVGQDLFLFNDSVAANIACGVAAPEREAVIAAARNAHALAFIEALPRGFDTPVGDRGSLLSGGQRQRLAIARAFYKDAPILVLDEATSALDTATEQAVQVAVDRLRNRRTTLIIAHRLSTVRGADRIAVLEQGRLIDVGRHEALLGRCPVYATLIREQLAGLHRPAEAPCGLDAPGTPR